VNPSAAVLTFGEAMLRLTSVPGVRLVDADRLEAHVAGAEANVAAALAQRGEARLAAGHAEPVRR
jgi:hypothetical protein